MQGKRRWRSSCFHDSSGERVMSPSDLDLASFSQTLVIFPTRVWKRVRHHTLLVLTGPVSSTVQIQESSLSTSKGATWASSISTQCLSHRMETNCVVKANWEELGSGPARYWRSMTASNPWICILPTLVCPIMEMNSCETWLTVNSGLLRS